ncbi:MAG: hypothetical protein HN742_23395 [Lentisphaerae bacterium]|jgi:hypothetical protein|nr:hypothetical protein [Lentisphaerota bacterium]MBT4819023.1 hypothetical protein [Lentisphaerota bacterium]MBT5605173.1 hypothetical protein [Lentisphaerota bacterium]MBT7054375.1 hypothetical protein [Lentisphaerota bacterium]MBT7844841.1 hypothetical protein [Lentisphaerota bacterium]
MQRVRIQVYQIGQPEPHTTVTIPLVSLRVGMKLLPQAVADLLEQQGIKLGLLREMIGEQEGAGTLIDVESMVEKLSISIE